MKPYFQDTHVTLYNGDCRAILPQLCGDVILTDPPYGETSLTWDVPVRDWLPLARAALAPHGSLWCWGSLRALLAAAAEFSSWQFAQDIVWEKHNGSSFHADRFRRVHEHVTHWYPAGVAWADVYTQVVTTPDATKRIIRKKVRPSHMGARGSSVYLSEDGGPRLMRSVLCAPSCHGTAIHPTEKPIAILLPLLQYSCPPGGTVIDPFAGSASTLDAARRIGRRAIGIEIDEKFCHLAARRLSQGILAFDGVEEV